jgi:hypothetical protein
MTIQNWSGTLNQFAVLFDGRVPTSGIGQIHLHRINLKDDKYFCPVTNKSQLLKVQDFSFGFMPVDSISAVMVR